VITSSNFFDIGLSGHFGRYIQRSIFKTVILLAWAIQKVKNII